MSVQPITCPHCREDIQDKENDWSRFLNENEAVVCPHCEKPLAEKATGRAVTGWHPLLRFGISLAVLSGLVFWLNTVFDVLSFKDNPGEIIYQLIFMGLISAYVASGRTLTKLKGLTVWAAIFMVAMLAYVYRHDLAAVKDRLLVALIPELGSAASDQALQFHVGEDGHFHIRARVNGVPVRFLVDTGASQIVLAPRDARRLGFDLPHLNFDQRYATANGMVRGATVALEDFRIGELHLKDVRASVNQAAMGESLLGMTFFNRLQRYAVEDAVLTLHWKP